MKAKVHYGIKKEFAPLETKCPNWAGDFTPVSPFDVRYFQLSPRCILSSLLPTTACTVPKQTLLSPSYQKNSQDE